MGNTGKIGHFSLNSGWLFANHLFIKCKIILAFRLLSALRQKSRDNNLENVGIVGLFQVHNSLQYVIEKHKIRSFIFIKQNNSCDNNTSKTETFLVKNYKMRCLEVCFLKNKIPSL